MIILPVGLSIEAAERLGVSKSLVDKYVLQALLRCRDALGVNDKLD
jgi:hypothetical protein